MLSRQGRRSKYFMLGLCKPEEKGHAALKNFPRPCSPARIVAWWSYWTAAASAGGTSSALDESKPKTFRCPAGRLYDVAPPVRYPTSRNVDFFGDPPAVLRDLAGA